MKEKVRKEKKKNKEKRESIKFPNILIFKFINGFKMKEHGGDLLNEILGFSM